MIVWHLLSNRWNSAITEYALSAARAVELAGHQSVFTSLAGSPAAARAKEAGLRVEALAGFTPAQAADALKLAKSVRPDLIITYGGPETVLSKLLRSATKARVVRFRGQEVDETGFLGRWRHRLSHAHVESLLAPSRGIAEALSLLDPNRPVDTVTLGCDESRFRRVQPAPGGRPEVMVLGRLDPVKGHAELFTIFAAMKTVWTRAERPRLHVIGQPANLTVDNLKTSATKAGLVVDTDVVFTATRVEKVATLLSAAVVGVVPSIGSEIIARVAEEFLLCGTPISVSGVGSLDETLCFAGAGTSYRNMDTLGAARLLKQLIEMSLDEGEAAKLKRAERACALFSLRAMGQALDPIIRCLAPN